MVWHSARHRGSPFNPFRAAVPLWGHSTLIIGSLSPKRDRGTKRVICSFVISSFHRSTSWDNRPCFVGGWRACFELGQPRCWFFIFWLIGDAPLNILHTRSYEYWDVSFLHRVDHSPTNKRKTRLFFFFLFEVCVTDTTIGKIQKRPYLVWKKQKQKRRVLRVLRFYAHAEYEV